METREETTAAMELARNLPALVAQLKALRSDMERKSKLYDALLLQTDSDQVAASGDQLHSSPAGFDLSQSGMRGSIFTPFANSQLDPRASQTFGDDLAGLEDEQFSNTLLSRQSSLMMKQKQRQPPRRPHHKPTHSMPQLSCRESGDYTVMWVSGECGISLRNFSRKASKVGAQIAVLQHADGVTTGISNCRLGDQLVSINDEKVDTLGFREIVDKLKTTRRPISLGFRTNPSVQTSPRASTSPRGFSATGGSRSSNIFSRRSKTKKTPPVTERHSVCGFERKPTGLFDEDESSDIVHETIDHPGYDHLTDCSTVERPTTTSIRSSTSTLPDEVEGWCREQEEMHSDIIVLLTETVLRCEKLQQENLDQLQNLMQLSPNSAPQSANSSPSSSYVGNGNSSKDEVETASAVSTGSPSSP
ncbi:hypothetical protein PHYBOEH_002021 [Phytophthora boehmeriae]|uniref:PDZ domain-containing protein n=1 Tax=Phytophthora boehmeriae TaxID=109152 RepID=A0A8T1WTR9_9STRA|nr:hypothetical protein PHYBOEH_002021 [Phytophthora boehmeriae]